MEGESGEQVSGLQKRNVVADPGRQSSLIALHPVFRLDALALSVIATATWLAGWVGGWVAVCHSRYCIKTTKRI